MKKINIEELTPVEKHGDIYLKRDDKFSVYNVCGGKARSAYQLIQKGIDDGYTEFVTAGSRMSPQCELVSCLCEALGVKCHLFMPRGKDTSVILNINKNKLSELHRTRVGYNNVVCKWASDYAIENGFAYIPFGMECKENIDITMHQVRNIPKEVKRIVIPVGSGMSFTSVLNGLEKYGITDKKVLGVSVGKDVQKTLEKYLDAPNIDYEIVKSELDYYKEPKDFIIDGVELDKTYEAKCLPYIESNDCLWIVGKRL